MKSVWCRQVQEFDWKTLLPESAEIVELMVVDGSGGSLIVIARIKAAKQGDALLGTLCVLSKVAGGNSVTVRSAPREERYTDFNTQEATYRGYVRFYAYPQPGPWRGTVVAQDQDEIIGFGVKNE